MSSGDRAASPPLQGDANPERAGDGFVNASGASVRRYKPRPPPSRESAGPVTAKPLPSPVADTPATPIASLFTDATELPAAPLSGSFALASSSGASSTAAGGGGLRGSAGAGLTRPPSASLANRPLMRPSSARASGPRAAPAFPTRAGFLHLFTAASDDECAAALLTDVAAVQAALDRANLRLDSLPDTTTAAATAAAATGPAPASAFTSASGAIAARFFADPDPAAAAEQQLVYRLSAVGKQAALERLITVMAQAEHATLAASDRILASAGAASAEAARGGTGGGDDGDSGSGDSGDAAALAPFTPALLPAPTTPGASAGTGTPAAALARAPSFVALVRRTLALSARCADAEACAAAAAAAMQVTGHASTPLSASASSSSSAAAVEASLGGHIDELEDQLRFLSGELAVPLPTPQGPARAQIAALPRSAASLAARLRLAAAGIEAARERGVSALAAEAEELRAQLRRLGDALAAAKKDAADAEARAAAAVASASAAATAAAVTDGGSGASAPVQAGEKVDKDAIIDSLEQRLSAAESALASARADASVSARCAALEAELSEARAVARAVVDRQQPLHDAHFAELHRREAAHHAALRALKTRLEEREGELQELRARTAELDALDAARVGESLETAAALTAAQAQAHELHAALAAAAEDGIAAYCAGAGATSAEAGARADSLRSALQQLDQLSKESADRKERKIAQLQTDLASAERDRSAYESYLDSERRDFIGSLAEVHARADRALDALDAAGVTGRRPGSSSSGPGAAAGAGAGVGTAQLSAEDRDRLGDALKELYREELAVLHRAYAREHARAQEQRARLAGDLTRQQHAAQTQLAEAQRTAAAAMAKCRAIMAEAKR